MKRFERNSAQNNEGNFEHNSHKPNKHIDLPGGNDKKYLSLRNIIKLSISQPLYCGIVKTKSCKTLGGIFTTE